MVQELGETVQEMMKADDKAVQDILNRRPNGHYWIVIAHKQTKQRMNTGEYVLVRHIKDYDVRPMPMLGTIVLEVRDGAVVKEQVNVHDAPIDTARVGPLLGFETAPSIQRGRRDIAGAYVYNKF